MVDADLAVCPPILADMVVYSLAIAADMVVYSLAIAADMVVY
jgi:hypothetical protein